MESLSKHILIVDDDIHLRFGLAIELLKAGYRVSEARDGEQALAMISGAVRNSTPFDLIILDLRMPFLNGMDMMDELDRKGISVPKIVVSGYGTKEFIEKVEKKGNIFLEKPFSLDDVTREVNSILQSKNGK